MEPANQNSNQEKISIVGADPYPLNKTNSHMSSTITPPGGKHFIEVDGEKCDCPGKFYASPYRWVILIVYAGMVCNNQMAFGGYTPLFDPLKTGFGVDEIWITVLLTQPHVTFFPMSFVVSFMFSKMKTIHVFWCSAILMMLGAWLRMFAFTGNNPFWVLLASTTLFTQGGPIILNGLSIMIINWFKAEEKARATAVVAVGATFGGLLGNIIPGIFAAGLDKTDPE